MIDINLIFLGLAISVSTPSTEQDDRATCTLQFKIKTLKLVFVYTLVNSRLFSHQVVSPGNIYYPIITKMPMSPMCEAVFT